MMKDKQEAALTPEIVAAQWSRLYRESEDFRAEFDKDPKAAVSRLIGQDLPSDMEVVVHRSKAGQVHVVVPDEMPDMNDEQLESISGGVGMRRSIGGGGDSGDSGGLPDWWRDRGRDRVEKPI